MIDIVLIRRLIAMVSRFFRWLLLFYARHSFIFPVGIRCTLTTFWDARHTTGSVQFGGSWETLWTALRCVDTFFKLIWQFFVLLDTRQVKCDNLIPPKGEQNSLKSTQEHNSFCLQNCCCNVVAGSGHLFFLIS